TREEVSTLGAPFMCCSYTNHFGNLDRTSFSSVSINDKAEAYRAAELLIECGHSKIAVLLDSIHDRSISERRYRGYCEALADAGIPLDEGLVCETVDFSMKAAYERTIRLLEERPDVTALFSVADSMAIAAMKAISDAGLSVPQDISIIAIDGIEMSLYTTPTLTTLAQPQALMGEKAVEILVDVLDGKASHSHVRLETTLRPGGTMGRLHP
ncbi:MAG TPA: substrate-binding domain-containing protein, partial [Atopobiaceae bacterium]|nr:substrate-binding domain-containing protein [Atopobiaceae bacterium]